MVPIELLKTVATIAMTYVSFIATRRPLKKAMETPKVRLSSILLEKLVKFQSHVQEDADAQLILSS